MKLPELKNKIYESGTTLVFKEVVPEFNNPVIIKTHTNPYPTFEDIAGYKREFAIGQSIESEGVLKYYDLVKDKNRYFLIMEDIGAHSLDHDLTSDGLDLELFFSIAKKIILTLKDIHSYHIVHKDIKPENILYNPATNDIRIIDFGISSELNQEKISFQSVYTLEGTIDYISPEQTGRINRSIDYRSDFYSLGITFYQLLTGSLPFNYKDTMEMVHSHIARLPEPPISKRSSIPKMLSEIVMKLTSKSMDGRYKSSLGLYKDLEKVEALFKEKSGEIFLLEEGISNDSFLLSQKLYGRDAEIQRILNHFSSMDSHSDIGVAMIRGEPGIGKSAFVNELHGPVTNSKGYFLYGKFEKVKQDIPLYSIIQVMRSVLSYILTEPPEDQDLWKGKIAQALGANANIIVQVIPELEKIVGSQPPIIELSPTETQNRFKDTMLNFFHGILAMDRPIVMFIDDLQWADLTSFKFLEALIHEPSVKNLFIIGSYRDNEVDPSHYLYKLLDTISQRTTLLDIHLKVLSREDIRNLVTDSFQFDSSDTMEYFVEMTHSRTMGNPFFIIQYLQVVYNQKHLFFDYSKNSWNINRDEIEKTSAIRDVNDVLTAKLTQTSEIAKNILKIASCIGSRFDLNLLSSVASLEKAIVAKHLIESMNLGFIHPLDDSYKYILDDDTSQANPDYQFLHDRIQHYFHNIFEPHTNSQFHYRIGKNVLSNLDHANFQENIYEVATHLTNGREHIPSEEIPSYIEICYIAGEKAVNNNAYTDAIRHLEIANREISRQNPSESILFHKKIQKLLASTYFLNGDTEQAEKLFSEIEAKISFRKEKLDWYYSKLVLYHSMSRLEDSISVGSQGLKFYGKSIPKSMSLFRVLIKISKFNFHMFNKNISDLHHLTEDTDSERVWFDRYLAIYRQSIYLSGNENLFVYLIFLLAIKIVKNGYTYFSSEAIVSLGVFYAVGMGKVNDGYDWAQFALYLTEKTKNYESKGMVVFLYACMILPWKKHLRDSIPLAREAFDFNLEYGNYLYATYSCIRLIGQRVNKGDNLTEIIEETEKYLPFVRKTQINNMIYTVLFWQNMARSLAGINSDPISWNSDNYNEEEVYKSMKESGYSAGVCLYHLYKARSYFFFHDTNSAYKEIQEAEKNMVSILGLSDYAEVIYYYCLIALSKMKAEDSRSLIGSVKKRLKKLKNWAKYCPENFSHKVSSISAGLAELDKNEYKAIQFYNEAIESSIENEFTQNTAIAHEMAFQFYKSRDLHSTAGYHLSNAIYYYTLWGANAKVDQLKKDYSNLLSLKSSTAFSHNSMYFLKPSSSGKKLDLMDVETIIQTSQSISEEIDLGRLLKKIIKIITENSGAERGYLILKDEIQWNVNLKWDISGGYEENLNKSVDDFEGINKNIIQRVISKETSFIISAEDPNYSQEDSKSIGQENKSIFCLPIISKSNFIGLFYLENNLMNDAFTEDRVELTEMIATQAAISIENSKLFSNTMKLNEDISRLNADLEKKVLERTKELQTTLGIIQKDISYAQKIQQSILPLKQEIQGIEYDIFFQPMDEVGGDIYDYFLLNENRIRIFLADATGHGVQAALVTMAIKSEYENLKKSSIHPNKILTILNDSIIHKFKSMYFSCLICDIDLSSKKLIYSAAGHPSQVFIHNNELKLLDKTGALMGLKNGMVYNAISLDYHVGDSLYLFSDGAFEVFNPAKEEYGEERYIELIQKVNSLPLKDRISSVKLNIQEFRERENFDDDIVLIAIDFLE